MKQKIGFLLALVVSPTVVGDDIAERYSFTRAIGFFNLVHYETTACKAMYPDLAEDIERNLVAWRAVNVPYYKKTLDKLGQMIAAEANPTVVYATVMRKVVAMQTVVQNVLLEWSLPDRRRLCEGYSSGKSFKIMDLEAYYDGRA